MTSHTYKFPRPGIVPLFFSRILTWQGKCFEFLSFAPRPPSVQSLLKRAENFAVFPLKQNLPPKIFQTLPKAVLFCLACNILFSRKSFFSPALLSARKIEPRTLNVRSKGKEGRRTSTKRMQRHSEPLESKNKEYCYTITTKRLLRALNGFFSKKKKKESHSKNNNYTIPRFPSHSGLKTKAMRFFFALNLTRHICVAKRRVAQSSARSYPHLSKERLRRQGPINKGSPNAKTEFCAKNVFLLR